MAVHRCRASIGALVLLACGPTRGDEGDAEVTTTGQPQTSSEAESGGATSSGDESSTTSSTSSGGIEGSSTGLADPCEGHAPDPGCPQGCMAVTAYPAKGCDVDVDDGRARCISPGESFDLQHDAAWWAEVEGEVLFLLSGHSCIDSVLAAPLGWNECTGAAGEPEPCGCLCTQGECRGVQDEATLSSCGVPSPCPDVPLVVKGSWTPEYLCLLTALRDRTPGLYVPILDQVNNGTDYRLLVEADGGAQIVARNWGGFPCLQAMQNEWMHSHRCQLAAADFFDACLTAATPGEAPVGCTALSTMLDPWLFDCVDMPATCP